MLTTKPFFQLQYHNINWSWTLSTLCYWVQRGQRGHLTLPYDTILQTETSERNWTGRIGYINLFQCPFSSYKPSRIRVHFIPWQVTFPTHQDLQGTCNQTDLLWANSSSAEHLAWLDCSSVNCFWSLSLVSFNILSFSAFSVLYNVKASFNWEWKHRRVTKVRFYFIQRQWFRYGQKNITCFNAALTWELCAKSVALLLWDTDWVAGDEGLICNGCDEECRPKETFKYIFFPVIWPVFPKLTLYFSFLKHFHCKYIATDI